MRTEGKAWWNGTRDFSFKKLYLLTLVSAFYSQVGTYDQPSTFQERLLKSRSLATTILPVAFHVPSGHFQATLCCKNEVSREYSLIAYSKSLFIFTGRVFAMSAGMFVQTDVCTCQKTSSIISWELSVMQRSNVFLSEQKKKLFN